MNFKLSFAALCLLIIVCLPRFNTNDFLIKNFVGKGKTVDSEHYIAMTDIYAGRPSTRSPEAPFTYRPLLPYVASFMPFSAMTSLNILNILVLWIGCISIVLLLKHMAMSSKEQVVGVLLYCVSFPVFYYGAIGYVDPALIGLLSLGLLLLYLEKWLLLGLVIFAGGFVKETIILLIPVAAVYVFVKQRKRLSLFMWVLVYFAIHVVSIKIARSLSLDPVQEVWTSTSDRIYENIMRPRTWVSFGLSFGLSGFLSLFYIVYFAIKKRFEFLYGQLPLIAGLFLSLALFFVAILAAYSDGRFIWTAIAFSIPLVLQCWKQRQI